MSVSENIKCMKCNRSFSIDYDFMLYPADDSSVRERFLSGSYFSYLCPYCHNKTIANHRFIYNDTNKGILVINDFTEGRLIKSRAEVYNRLKEEIGDEVGLYRIYGSRNPLEAINAIIFYENNLDIKYAYLTIFQFLVKLNEDSSVKYLNANPEYSSSGKLLLRANRSDGGVDRFEFPMDLYEMIEKFFLDRLKGYSDFLFNFSSAVAIFNASNDAELSEITLCALTRVGNDNVLLQVPGFLRDEIKVGASVNYLDSEIKSGIAERLLDINTLAIGGTTNSLPMVLNINDLSLELKPLREGKPNDLALYLNDIDYINTLAEDEVLSSQVYALKELSQNKKTMGLEFQCTSDKEGRLIIYLDKESIPDSDDYLIPLSLKDVLSFVVRRMDLYSGIVIKGKGIKDARISNHELLNIKYNHYASDKKLLINLLNSLNKEELNYIYPEARDILLMRYKDGEGDSAIAKAFDITLDELNSVFINTDSRLLHIVLNKYKW